MTEQEYKDQLKARKKARNKDKYTASKKEYAKLSKSEKEIFDGLASKFAGAGQQIILKAQDLEPNELQSEEALEFLKSLDEVPEKLTFQEKQSIAVNKALVEASGGDKVDDLLKAYDRTQSPVERYKYIEKCREELKDDPTALYQFNKSL